MNRVEVGSVVKYRNESFHDLSLPTVGVVVKIYTKSSYRDCLVFMTDGQYLLDIPERFVVLWIMIKQKIDIGDLVECYLGKGEEKMTGVVVERKAINPAYNTDRTFHPDEYHCKVLILNSEPENEQRWIRTKWLKLLSKSSWHFY